MADSERSILVIGAVGQLGTDLMARLGERAVGVDYPDLDVRNVEQVAAVVAQHAPRWVINCAAVTNVDGCETAVEEAFAVNAVGARNVARAAAEHGAGVIYISTDYVFGLAGPRAEPYVESDCPGPQGVYAASKLAGEHLTLAAHPEAVVARTCGLYGHAGARGKGGNFVETMLRLGGEGRDLRVVSDQRLSPTSTVACAEQLERLIAVDARGIVHVTAADHCTWHDFAVAIFELAGMDVAVTPIPTSEYPTAAPRPLMSALRSERLAGLGLDPMPSWRAMLKTYLATRPGG
jgi:dTDP-4-dehydrorhamnose reductase